MPVTIELPHPLEEEITQEAQRDGVSPAERATLLLYLAHALVSDRGPAPFKEVVKLSLARHSLDPDQVGSALEELVKLYLAGQGGEQSLSLPNALDALPEGELTPLAQWRNAFVHNVEADPEAAPSSCPQAAPRRASTGDNEMRRDQERDPELVARVRNIRGRFARSGGEWASDELLRDRQADKEKEERLAGESPP